MRESEPHGTVSYTAEYISDLAQSDRIDGRYELKDKLGAGGMSDVYLAHDHKNNLDVAVKFMKTELGGSARRRFFREFNTISGIEHPCCLRVYEIGETQDAPYFTMELHPGQTLDAIIGDPVEMIAPLLVDLTLAVDYVHSQGIIHRDIKPSNVMVQRDGGQATGRLSCKLADFGLAKFYQLDSSLTAERGFVGTPAYCAPEQIDGTEVDQRADLYAVATLAFELLSGGRHPFAAQRSQGMHALLHAQVSVEPPRLADINPGIPIDVSDVIGSYLTKEPDLRPNSALPLRRVLCEEFGIEVDSRLEKLSSPSEVKLNAVGFVCRESELAEVDNYLGQRFSSASERRTEQDEPPLMLFSGEPGTGKTSIMVETTRRAIGRGVHVFEGRCFDGSTSSFQPVVEILRQILTRYAQANRSVEESTLLGEFAGTPQEFNRMNDVLQNYHSELLRIAPELRRWLTAETQPPAYRNEPEYMFRALAAMFIELSEIAPICLAFDDIQWADKSTLSLLQHISASVRQTRIESRNGKSYAAPMAIVCATRTGDDSLAAFLASMGDQKLVKNVDVLGLRGAETRELLALRLGCLADSVTPELTDAIDALCQGNPFFISETIREWHTRGMVVRTNDGWQRVHKSLEEDSSLPSTVRSALQTRISDLSEPAKLAVPAAAIIGRVVDLDLLEAVVKDIAEEELLDLVDELLSKRVFVETNSAGRVAFSHDLLRETVLADMSSSRQRALHRKVASVLEERAANSGKEVPPALLAHHYLAGEMTTRAFECLLNAADLAVRAYAFQDALELLDKAENNLPDSASQNDQLRLHELIAEAAGRTNQQDRAYEAINQALHCTELPLERAHILRLQGNIYWVHSRLDESHESLDAALAELGFPRAKSRIAQAISITFSLFCFHVLPTRIVGLINRSKSKPEENRLACHIYYDYAHASTDFIDYTQICAANVRRAKSVDSDAAKGVAYAKYGMNLGITGMNLGLRLFGKALRPLSIRYGELGLAAAERDGRADVIASVRSTVGFCYYCVGRHDSAESILREAEQTLIRSRDVHTCYLYHFLRHSYSVRGIADRVLEVSHKEYEVSAATQNVELMGWAKYGFSHGYALQGRIAESLAAAAESIELTSRNNSGFTSVALMEQGFALLQASEYERAAQTLEDAWAKMKKHLFFFEIAAFVSPRAIEAYLGPKWNEKDGPSKLRAAQKFAWHAWLFSFGFPNMAPSACRSLGRLAYAKGKKRKALRYFNRAIEHADRIGARYDKARALLDRSLAGSQSADTDRKAGFEILKEIEAVIPGAELDAHGMSD